MEPDLSEVLAEFANELEIKPHRDYWKEKNITSKIETIKTNIRWLIDNVDCQKYYENKAY